MGIKEMVLERCRKEGREESQINFVKKLLLAKRFTTNEIATFVGVTESFVLKVMKSLNK
ncbi:hypothetical protein [Dyadobacter subterraneus]|uniref:hypothetical protein n=1 Tax=Dyadobacter subterraneus TaxID=2773304 RepID=UPI0036D333A3